MLRSVAGSIFFASQCAAALSSTADMLVRNCTNMGTEILYMEIVMECGSCAGEQNEKELKLTERRGHCHVPLPDDSLVAAIISIDSPFNCFSEKPTKLA